MSERYKGCIVDPRVYELVDGSGWTAEVYVAKDVGADTVDHRFALLGTFTTRDAALASAITSGKRKVDEGLVDPEIASIIEQQTRLPSTHRHGYGSRTDDVAEGTDGLPTRIPTSGNPDDQFS